MWFNKNLWKNKPNVARVNAPVSCLISGSSKKKTLLFVMAAKLKALNNGWSIGKYIQVCLYLFRNAMPCLFWPFIINHHNMHVFSFNWPIEKHACVHISLHSWYSFRITFTAQAWSYTSCSTVSVWFSGLAFLRSLLFTCFWPPVVPAFTAGQTEATANLLRSLYYCLICAVNSAITCTLFSTYHILVANA